MQIQYTSPCIENGRGLMNLEKEYEVGLSKYMIEKDDPKITALLKHPRLCTLFQKKLSNIS